MSAAANHIIKNVTLDFQYNGKTEGFSFLQEVKDWFDEFIEQLDQELNQFSSVDTVVSINELQLDIDLAGADWRQDATHKMIEQVKDRIQLIQNGAITSPGYEVKQKEQHFAEAFLYYLKHGHLSWHTSTVTEAQWNEQLEKLILNADKKFVQELRDLLAESGLSRERLLQTIPFQSAVELFGLISLQQPLIHQKLIHDLQLLMKIANLHHYSYLKQVVYRAFLLSLSDKADHLQIKQELSESIHKKASINPSIIESVSNLPFQSQRLITLKQELITKEKSDKSKSEKQKYKLQKLVQEEQELLYRNEKMKQPLPETIFISNAGMVILAAFLPAFFEKVKLSEDQMILDEEKAVCLVQYLVTGTERMQEYELVLPKILCGIAIDKPVNTENFYLNTLFRKEAEAVLTSVIEYWNILQSTSVEGLRESFLKRNGKLSYDGKDWMLQVEQNSYDMLLQHLPWNISMIKLPWMNHLLKTEWNY